MTRRFVFISLVLVLILAFSAMAFAEEKSTPTKLYNLEVTSEGIVGINEASVERSTTSSISGYDARTVVNTDSGVTIFVDASGFGGMGVTIKASSSWNGTMYVHMFDNLGNVVFESEPVSSNGETQFHNLWHWSPDYFGVNCTGIPDGVSVYVQVWIYG